MNKRQEPIASALWMIPPLWRVQARAINLFYVAAMTVWLSVVVAVGNNVNWLQYLAVTATGLVSIVMGISWALYVRLDFAWLPPIVYAVLAFMAALVVVLMPGMGLLAHAMALGSLGLAFLSAWFKCKRRLEATH